MGRFWITYILLFLLKPLAGQPPSIWADSILACIPNDQINKNTITPKYGDTLLQIFTLKD
jgi:hypothetical protein